MGAGDVKKAMLHKRRISKDGGHPAERHIKPCGKSSCPAWNATSSSKPAARRPNRTPRAARGM